MPRAVVASLVALVSCPGDRMPIWRTTKTTGEIAGSQNGLQDAEGSKEDAVGIRNGLRNQMG